MDFTNSRRADRPAIPDRDEFGYLSGPPTYLRPRQVNRRTGAIPLWDYDMSGQHRLFKYKGQFSSITAIALDLGIPMKLLSKRITYYGFEKAVAMGKPTEPPKFEYQGRHLTATEWWKEAGCPGSRNGFAVYMAANGVESALKWRPNKKNREYIRSNDIDPAKNYLNTPLKFKPSKSGEYGIKSLIGMGGI